MLTRKRIRSAGDAMQAIAVTRLTARDAMAESALGVVRRPGRAVIASLGTVLGVAAVLTIIGLSDSARSAVASFFNAQLATEVSFTDTPGKHDQVLTEAAVARLTRLHGVAHAGLIWNVDGAAPFDVQRAPDAAADSAVSLPFTAASAGAFGPMHPTVAAGRLYDAGAEERHAIVGVLGAAAASQLGITSTAGQPAVFVGGVPITIVGIVSNVSEEDQVLLGVIVPPYVANLLGTGPQERRVIVETALGSAQTIGAQGPYALSPFDPQRISAQVPPNPSTLRQQVEQSLNGLLLALAVVAFFIGTVAIANTTLLSVVQRRSEIGLRRALGFRPRHIATLVLGEAAVTGTIGGAIGAAVGVVSTGAIAVSRGWTPVLDLRLVIGAPLIGMVTGMIAGAYPSWRASRITPAAALSSQ